MKKLLIKVFQLVFSSITAFVLILALAGYLGLGKWILNAMTTTGGYGQMLLRLREVQKVKQVDLLFVGSSHVYRGYDPRIFKSQKIQAFNIGSSAQTPFNSYFLLKEYLPKVRAKYIVLDLYWGALGNDGVESSIDILSNSDVNDNLIEMAILTKDVAVYNSATSNYLRRLYFPLSFENQENFITDKYIPGGFTESTLIKNRLNESQLKNINKFSINLSALQIKYINKIINLCNQYDTQLLFVVTPVTKELYKKIENYTLYQSIISRIAKDNHIVLLDYNTREELNLNSKKDFLDKDHLIQSGVVKLNRLFIADLHKLNLI